MFTPETANCIVSIYSDDGTKLEMESIRLARIGRVRELVGANVTGMAGLSVTHVMEVPVLEVAVVSGWKVKVDRWLAPAGGGEIENWYVVQRVHRSVQCGVASVVADLTVEGFEAE